MNLKIALFTMVVIVSGCKQEEPVVEIEAGLESYYDMFVEEAQARGIDVSVDTLYIQFSDLENPAHRGLCTIRSSGERIVEIDRPRWNDLSEGAKIQVVFHELGHCVLNRTHTNEVDPNEGVPESVMNSYAFSSSVFMDRYEDYVEELFNRRAHRYE